MAGVAAARPPAIMRGAMSSKCESPMKMTSVSEVPTFAQSIFNTSWPVMNVTTEV